MVEKESKRPLRPGDSCSYYPDVSSMHFQAIVLEVLDGSARVAIRKIDGEVIKSVPISSLLKNLDLF